MKLEFAQ